LILALAPYPAEHFDGRKLTRRVYDPSSKPQSAAIPEYPTVEQDCGYGVSSAVGFSC
jgi:hypothetical protein